MTYITINDQAFNQQIPEEITIHNFLDYIISENIQTMGHIVTEIMIDDQAANLDINNPKLNQSINSIKYLDVKTKSSIVLAFEAIESIPLYLEDINSQINFVVSLLRNGNNEQGNLKFAECIDTIELFIQLFTSVQMSLNRNLSRYYKKSEKTEKLEIELLEIVKQIISSREIDDVAMLCDLLEYELTANLNKWKTQVIPELLELKKLI